MAKRKKSKKNKGMSNKKKADNISIDRPIDSRNIQLISIPEFSPDDPRSSLYITPKGSPGIYSVAFVLTIPGKELYQSDINIPKIMQSGDSLLFIGKGHLKVNANLDDQTILFNIFPNSDGRLAKIKTSVFADSFIDAEKRAYDSTIPFLNHLSFVYDTGLNISGFEITEELTQSQKWSFEIMGQYKAMDLTKSNFLISKEYRSIFAMYREAMVSTNVFYRFLSLYKITEGIKKLRSKILAGLPAQEKKGVFPLEQFPDGDIATLVEDDLVEFFVPYKGEKYSNVINKFGSIYRNAIAHLNPSGDEVEVDKLEDIYACINATHILKYIVREIIANTIQAEHSIMTNSNNL